jgi:hypothetical protein
MLAVLKSKHFAIGLALFCGFWIGASFIENRLVLLATNALVLFGSTAVGVAFMPVAWRAINESAKSNVQHIALGITYAWFFGAMWRIWTLLWLTSGQQSWMVNNDIVAFFQTGIFFGACYHLTSPGAIGDDMPRLKWIVLGLVLGVSVLTVSLLTYFNPDTTGFVEAIKPYVPR